MTSAMLIGIAWKSLLVSGLALIALRLLRRRSSAERSWVAHAGLAATLLVPVLTLWGPQWRVEAPAPVARVLASGEATATVLPPPTAAESTAPTNASAPAAETSRAWLTPSRLALLAYALPAALLLLVMLAAVIRLYVLRSRADVLVEQGWLSAMARAQRRMGFKHGTALLVTHELGSPVSWGVMRPIILLNEEAVGSQEQAEAIIAHELAHVARLDWAKLIVGRFATALFWFNPLVWMLANQCHQLREEAADDAVLASDVPSTDYAQLLVGAARHESRGLLLAANGVAPVRGSLAQRVTRILDGTLRRAPAHGRWAAACTLGALLVAAPLAALTPVGSLVGGGGQEPTGTPAAQLAAQPDAPQAAREAEGSVAGDLAEAAADVETAAAELAAPLEATPDSSAIVLPALSGFNAIHLSGGGHVVLRHGGAQSVRILRGGGPDVRVSVSGESLSVACERRCGDLHVEVVTPSLNAVAIRGGGVIRVESGFPVQSTVALAIDGGGTIDARALSGLRVAAATNGGGEILASARDQLAASTNGGGIIRYWGDASVSSASRGGGSIERGGR